MSIFKLVTAFFSSLGTSLWCLGFLLVMFLAGAIIMPGRQEYQALHSIPMFQWLHKQPFKLTWWLWCLIGILAVLGLNTLFCSIESIVRKRKVTQWLLLISPQIIHAGFLFVLIAHLMSAAGASQRLAPAVEGTQLSIYDDNTAIRIKDINIRMDYYGYITDWEVSMEYLSDGEVLLKDKIRPNSPSVQMGFNINVKDLRTHPREAVLLQINREPGVLWALMGGILLMVGIITLILLKIKMEK